MLQVIPIPAFTDNYIWLLTNEERKYAAIVDPGDAEPVICELESRGMELIALLITHHHSDHVGGIAKLVEKYPNVTVYGPAQEFIPHITQALDESKFVELEELNLSFKVLDIPGHTAGHIAYYCDEEKEKSIFCGDTLFANGCGRVFDGTIEDLHASLNKLAKLPVETRIYCAHEYTLDNIGFAKWVEPNNQDLIERQEQCWELIDGGRSTIPSTLEMEFKTNPFLRTHLPEVIAKAEEVAGRETHTPLDVFTVLRVWKDTEYD